MADLFTAMQYFNFVLNSVIFIALLAISRIGMSRIKRMLDILDNGGWRHCPLYRESADSPHRRWYDSCAPAKNIEKGGE